MTYDKYSPDGFGDDEHQLLANYCHDIALKGGFFMVSNSDTPFIRNLYKRYNIEVISASRSVACKSHKRGKENELLIGTTRGAFANNTDNNKDIDF